MRNCIVLRIVVSLAATPCLWGAQQATNAANEKAVAIVWAGPTNEALLTAVLKHVRANYRCPVRQKPSQDAPKDWSDDALGKLGKLVTSNDVCLLVLANMPADSKLTEKVNSSLQVGLLNVTGLRLQQMNDPKAQETYLRRVEKESMRVIGESFGLPACPFPLCAMNQSKTERALDVKGYNLCPPCDVKAQAILKQKGVVWKIEPPRPPKPAAEPPPAEKK